MNYGIYDYAPHTSGTTWVTPTFQVLRGGVPDSLVGASIRMLAEDCDGNIILDISNGSGITITDAANAYFKPDEVVLTATEGTHTYEVKITFADGRVKIWQKGKLPILPTKF